MKPFLKEIISKYINEDQDLSEHVFVFPNRRAGLFFQKYLGELIQKPVWSPSIFTINEFVSSFSNMRTAEPLETIFRIHKIYCQLTRRNESFDEFYFWGEMLLQDFDDVDKYMADPSMLFSNISAIKEIEKNYQYLTPEQIEIIRDFWGSFNVDQLSEHQKNFIAIWEVLEQIYQKTKAELKNAGKAYEGMIFREVADKAQKNELNYDFSTAIFAGFNALTRSEQVLMKDLEKKNMAVFYWDYHPEYINDYHEAGYFMKDNLKDFNNDTKSIDQRHDELFKPEKINVWTSPSDYGQTKLIPGLINSLSDPSEPDEKTAIILADENLLIPVLQSVPESISDINVTMGYPLKSSPVFAFWESLVNLHVHKRTLSNDAETTYLYHYKDIEQILRHHLTGFVIPDETSREILKEMAAKNKVYVSTSELSREGNMTLLFHHETNSIHLEDRLLEIIDLLIDKIMQTKNFKSSRELQFTLEFLLTIRKTLNKINDLIQESGTPLTPTTYLKITSRALSAISIPFTGEPLKGIQVMGILETRCLDFENLIIISANEGILPKSVPAPSFIPPNLRKAYKLPTLKHQDSIFAYYFYRLLHRSKNINLIYSERSQGLKTGEPSRYIYQLQYGENNNTVLKNLPLKINIRPASSIVVKKNKAMMEKLMRYTVEKGEHKAHISPSALNTYLDCSLRFYFRYIARIYESEEVSENLELLDFGNILHKAAEEIYKPYLNKTITPETITDLLKDSEKTLEITSKAFADQYFKSEKDRSASMSGLLPVINSTIHQILRKLLEYDKTIAPFKLIGLENKYLYPWEVEINGKTCHFKLQGTIDRIDEIDAQIRIIDYKTGKTKRKASNVEDLFKREYFNRNNAVFQLLFYAMVFDHEKATDTYPGLYFTRELFKDVFDWHVEINRFPVESFYEYKTVYLEHLKILLDEIVNPEIAFSQTKDDKFCQTCPYNQICRR